MQKIDVPLPFIVHRDLKPENVLFKTPEHHSPLVIADFGIAKHLEYSPDLGDDENEGGGTDSVAGSFGYAAPEVLGGKRHGVKVDCWSIG